MPAGAVSQSVRVARVSLLANQLQGVNPPVACRKVVINNQTPGTLAFYTNTDLTKNEYFYIAAGFERPIDATFSDGRDGTGFSFWLQAELAGEVVLIWST